MTLEELIKLQFPGRLNITLVEAGRAIGMSAQSSYNRRHLGTFPLPVRKIGGKPMVSLIDLIDYIRRPRPTQQRRHPRLVDEDGRALPIAADDVAVAPDQSEMP